MKGKGSPVVKGMSVVALLILLIGYTGVLVYWAQGSWYTRVGIVLEIIAFYSIGLSFVIKAGVLRDYTRLAEKMTSPNLFEFMAGNMTFLGICFLISSIGDGPRRSTSTSPNPMGCLGEVLSMLGLPVSLFFFIFHLIVVMPFAYIGYLVVSSIVERIIRSVSDIGLTITDGPTGSVQELRIREIIVADPEAAKSILIGVPAIVLALMTRIVEVLLGT
jgi:hypothetical protein